MQLVQIEMDGFMDMLKNAKQYGKNKKVMPTVMTVFHSDNDLMMASLQKGGNSLMYIRSTNMDLLVAACRKCCYTSSVIFASPESYAALCPSLYSQARRIEIHGSEMRGDD